MICIFVGFVFVLIYKLTREASQSYLNFLLQSISEDNAVGDAIFILVLIIVSLICIFGGAIIQCIVSVKKHRGRDLCGPSAVDAAVEKKVEMSPL